MVTILKNIIEMDKDLDVLLSSYDMHTAIISNLNSTNLFVTTNHAGPAEETG